MKDKLFLANFSSLLASNFAVQGIRFVTIILLTRVLGPQLFGTYNYILLLITLSAVVVEFGLKNFAIREFSLGLGSHHLTKRIFKIRFLASLISCAIVTLLAFQAFRGTFILQVAFIFSISLVIDAFLADFIAISQERLHLQALGQALQALVYLAGIYLVTRNSADLRVIGVAFCVSHVLLVATYLAGINKAFPQAADTQNLKVVIYGGLPFLFANIAAMLQSQMDIFLLGQFHFTSVLGDYSACLKLLSVPLGIVNSYVSSLQPRLARLINQREELVTLLKKNVKILLAIAIPVNVVCALWARPLVNLFFGSKYSQAPIYLFPLSLVTTVFVLTLLPMHALFVSNQTKRLLFVTISNVCLSVVSISVCLKLAGPPMVPWAMFFVQGVCCVQAWASWLRITP